MAPVMPDSSRNNPVRPGNRVLGSKPIQPNSFNPGAFNSTPPKPSFGSNSMTPVIHPNYTGGFSQPPQASTNHFAAPNYTGNVTMQPLQPNFTGGYLPKPPQAPQNNISSPNYKVSLPSMTPIAAPSTQAMSPPPFFNAGMGVLAPSKPQQPTWGNSTSKSSKDDWGDFDPLG